MKQTPRSHLTIITSLISIASIIGIAKNVAAQDSTSAKTYSEQEKSAGIFLEQTDDVYTDDNGAPIPSLTASRTCGRDGPIVLEDITLINTLARFSRERIPERVVHALGTSAMGYFEVTHDISKYTKAAVFAKVGLKTRVVVRFSTVTNNLGGATTARDPRGFAIKFYTSDGNLDLVGNNTPIFFIREPLLFASMIHAFKRNPKTGRKDPNTMWDFITRNHQTLAQVLITFTDGGTPDGFRYMHGFGSHTFVLVNADNYPVYCKFHFLSDQGIRNLTREEAVRLAGENPDYGMQDLYEAIERRDFPSWTMKIQVMTFEEAAKFKYNVLDLTKQWPTDLVPLIPVGKLVLNKNPENFFQGSEQLAFDVSNLVPGIQPSRDRVLQARLFSYKDTHRHRLGPNFMQLPGNAPLRPAYVSNVNRDGPMCFYNEGSNINYYPNSFGYDHPDISTDFVPLMANGQVKRFDISEDDNYSQATDYYNNLSEGDKIALAKNIAFDIKSAKKIIQERVIESFERISSNLALRIENALYQLQSRTNT